MEYLPKSARRLLMVDPSHYRIEYAINPHMRDARGRLQEVDPQKARSQWTALKEKFRELGLEVTVLPAAPEFPDIVFAANQSFPFVDPKTGRPSVLMSRMNSEQRKGEVAHFEEWYRRHGFEIHHLREGSSPFEGNGDALLHPGRHLIWGGHGFRTFPLIYEEIAERWGFQVHLLKLRLPEFYHLDTCFSILNQDTAAVLPEALEPEGLRTIKSVFKQVIELNFDECLKSFAANCYCPNGRDVVVQRGCPRFTGELQRLGFTVHPLETEEFIKAGGSVFCLKMALPD